MGQIELNRVLMLNWIVWNKTVLTSVCKQKTVLMLNWTVWNRTVYIYKNGKFSLCAMDVKETFLLATIAKN